ncbi:hypothetical protein ABVT39_027825 [Epinephelus coioides]
MAPSSSLPASITLNTNVTAAIADIKAEIRDIKRQWNRHTDEKLEYLSDQVARLQLEVNAVTRSSPQRTVQDPHGAHFIQGDRYNRDGPYRSRPGREDYSPHRGEYYDYSAPARHDEYTHYRARSPSRGGVNIRHRHVTTGP